METGSNTSPRHITTCPVQFNGMLVQKCYRKTKSRLICKYFCTLKFLWHNGNATLKLFNFRINIFFQRKLCVFWNYSQAIL